MSKQNFLNYFGSKRKLNEENNREVQPPKKKSNEYVFQKEKFAKWQKQFIFWDTPNQTPCEDPTKKKSWIKVNESNFTCWVCNLYPNLSNQENEVTKGMNKFVVYKNKTKNRTKK